MPSNIIIHHWSIAYEFISYWFLLREFSIATITIATKLLLLLLLQLPLLPYYFPLPISTTSTKVFGSNNGRYVPLKMLHWSPKSLEPEIYKSNSAHIHYKKKTHPWHFGPNEIFFLCIWHFYDDNCDKTQYRHRENGVFVLGGPETQLHEILRVVHDGKNHGRSKGEQNFREFPVTVGGQGRAMHGGFHVSLVHARAWVRGVGIYLNPSKAFAY